MRVARTCLVLLAATAALGGCDYAGRPGPRDRMVPEAVTGAPVSCIPLNAIRETQVRDGRTIDFLSGSRRGWRNVLPAQCPSLAFERAVTDSTSLSQLCSTDIIRVLAQFGGRPRPAAACGLGQFTPIELR